MDALGEDVLGAEREGASGRVSPSLLSAAERKVRAPWEPGVPAADKPVNFAGDKWEALFEGEDPAPKFNRPELAEGLAILMRRLDLCEAARQDDRKHLVELKAENKDLRKRVGVLQTVLSAAAEGALYCKDAPIFDPSPIWDPRSMSIPEHKWLQESLGRLRENDLRIPEVARILGIVPTDGRVCIDLTKATPRQQWQLYYYLKFKKIYRRHTRPLRAAQLQRGIDEAGPSSIVFEQRDVMADWDEEDDDNEGEDQDAFGFGDGWDLTGAN